MVQKRRVLSMLVAAVVVLTPFLTPSAVAGENPHNRDCDGIAGTIALVCAGADAGGNGECENLSPTEISCWYTYGWNLLAESPAMLPGEGELVWSFLVTACITGEGCTVIEAGAGVFLCSWTLPTDTCAEQHMGEGEEGYVLALGQCVTVTAWASAHTAAQAPGAPGALWEAEIAQTSEGGGAACALDDGRD